MGSDVRERDLQHIASELGNSNDPLQQLRDKAQFELSEKNELQQLLAEQSKRYQELNKEYILFKEKTFDILEQEKKIVEMLQSELEKKKRFQLEAAHLKKEMEALERRTVQLTRKYHSLKQSKLGKLTTMYWKIRKRLTRRRS
ncbi:hypothetical protein [Scopulibacillus darangshiensis]|uniref:hypothetical protein n=1 Tax=Scopulibacillus darangshiensis TaxID=442528 RepID=UPI0010450A43|nr:hypothetical protein [Scopulibacillus darangshiensis]